MVLTQVECYHCGSGEVIKSGTTRNGKQRYLCRGCGKTSRADRQPNGYTEEQRDMILRAYQERSSLRGLTRTFGVSRATVIGWLKKSRVPARVE